MIIRVQDKSEKLGVRAWIYTWPGCSYFFRQSSASFQRIENETKCLPHPYFGEVFFSVIFMATKHLPCPLGFFSIISKDWKWNKISIDKISSALFHRLKMNICYAPLLARVSFSVISTATKHLPCPLHFFSIISMETKRLLTRFLQPYFMDWKWTSAMSPLKFCEVLNCSRKFTWRLAHS